jgi:hypothetical protein
VIQNRQRIPFTIPRASGDELTMTTMVERQSQGLVGLEGDTLVLQFQTTTKETSMTSLAVKTEASDVTELRIPLDQLATVSSRGWWGRRVTLAANDLSVFSDVPGARGEQVTLRFKWRDRAAADDLVTALSFELSDLGHARLDRRIRELEGEASPPGELPAP